MSVPDQVMTAEKLNDLRRRVLTGQDFTKEELRTSVRALVGDRIAQAQSAATASKKRPSRAVNLDDLLPAEPTAAPKPVDLGDLLS